MDKGHALIVEDELEVGLDLQAMLAGMGFTSFAFASTAEQALQQARLRPPDLIAVDLGLLGGDGISAVTSILEAGLGASVVFVSGDRERLSGLRGWARVEKPVSPAAFHEAVERAMARGERRAAAV